MMKRVGEQTRQRRLGQRAIRVEGCLGARGLVEVVCEHSSCLRTVVDMVTVLASETVRANSRGAVRVVLLGDAGPLALLVVALSVKLLVGADFSLAGQVAHAPVAGIGARADVGHQLRLDAVVQGVQALSRGRAGRVGRVLVHQGVDGQVRGHEQRRVGSVEIGRRRRCRRGGSGSGRSRGGGARSRPFVTRSSVLGRRSHGVVGACMYM